VPRFAHVPLVCGEDGSRLAKRHGSVTLTDLRERGYEPSDVLALLATSFGIELGGEPAKPAHLLENFSLEGLSNADVTFIEDTGGVRLVALT
jgi:glutamyl-tRNA synthetase